MVRTTSVSPWKNSQQFANRILPSSFSFRGYVTDVETDVDVIDKVLLEKRYTTKRGEHFQGCARPIGEGKYFIVDDGLRTHLVYEMEVPHQLNEVQTHFHIPQEGSYVISVKNPHVWVLGYLIRIGSSFRPLTFSLLHYFYSVPILPTWPQLKASRSPMRSSLTYYLRTIAGEGLFVWVPFPASSVHSSSSRHFIFSKNRIPCEPTDVLNVKNCEILLLAGGEHPDFEFGIKFKELAQLKKNKTEQDALKELHLEGKGIPTGPMKEGVESTFE